MQWSRYCCHIIAKLCSVAFNPGDIEEENLEMLRALSLHSQANATTVVANLRLYWYKYPCLNSVGPIIRWL